MWDDRATTCHTIWLNKSLYPFFAPIAVSMNKAPLKDYVFIELFLHYLETNLLTPKYI